MTLPSAAADEAAEVGTPAIPVHLIEGRSLGRIAWDRLKRDRIPMISAAFILLLILVAVFANQINELLGVNDQAYNSDLVDPTILTPIGKFGGMSLAHPFGVEPVNGRDVFARIVQGSRPTLIVAVFATTVQMTLGVIFGAVAGYFGGIVDAVLSRLMDIFLAFPLLLFLISVGSVIPPQRTANGNWLTHILVMILVIGTLTWAYPARLLRGQVISLREREFVDAARALGASSRRIIFKEIVPNLAGPILVYTSLAIPLNILLEAYLSFFGVGTPLPFASWGQMLSNAVDYYTVDPTYMVIPGLAVFLTVLAFNLFGDGLRDALDPRAGR